MNSADDLRLHLIKLRSERRQGKRNSVRRPPAAFIAPERHQVLAKTAGCCHIWAGRLRARRGKPITRWRITRAAFTELIIIFLRTPSSKTIAETYAGRIQYILNLGVWASTRLSAALRLVLGRWITVSVRWIGGRSGVQGRLATRNGSRLEECCRLDHGRS